MMSELKTGQSCEGMQKLCELFGHYSDIVDKIASHIHIAVQNRLNYLFTLLLITLTLVLLHKCLSMFSYERHLQYVFVILKLESAVVISFHLLS